MVVPTYIYPYHGPARNDGGTDHSTHEWAVHYAEEMYEDDVHAAVFKTPNETITTTHYPKQAHSDTINQVPICEIFDEVFISPLFARTNTHHNSQLNV